MRLFAQLWPQPPLYLVKLLVGIENLSTFEDFSRSVHVLKVDVKVTWYVHVVQLEP